MHHCSACKLPVKTDNEAHLLWHWITIQSLATHFWVGARWKDWYSLSIHLTLDNLTMHFQKNCLSSILYLFYLSNATSLLLPYSQARTNSESCKIAHHKINYKLYMYLFALTLHVIMWPCFLFDSSLEFFLNHSHCFKTNGQIPYIGPPNGKGGQFRPCPTHQECPFGGQY